MALVGYGSYDTVSYRPREVQIFEEHFETLYPEGAIKYEESETTDACAELRIDEEGYWWARYMGPFGDRISEVHDSEQSAHEKYQELAARVRH